MLRIQNPENKIRLKPNDSYMYQIQGQLEITDRKWKLLFFKFSLLILFEIKLYKSFLVFFSDPFLLW
jgi:hypothetical protein